MDLTVDMMFEPLIKRKIFTTEGEAIRELLRDYILHRIAALKRQIARFERKYGMNFKRFGEYMHERSLLLEAGSLDTQQRQVLGRAIMEEEDDWLDWKVNHEMLESLLGLRQEVTY